MPKRERRPGVATGRARETGLAVREPNLRRRIGAWRDTLYRETKEHPGRTIAMAFGAGYLLGGGLFSRLTARVLGTGIRIGLRVAMVPFVTQTIVALGEEMLSVTEGDSGTADPTLAHSGPA